jgi:hypothetical protein
MDRKKQHGNTKYWNLDNNYPIKALLEHNVTEIRQMNLLEKNLNVPMMLKSIIEWGTCSYEEAIGILEIVKQHFIHLAETEEEKKIKN